MPFPESPRVLVIRRRYLGDIVLAGAVFRNIRLHWPDAHLAALVEPAFAPILTMNPDVNATFVLPRQRSKWMAFVHRLRAAKFTHVLDLDNNDRTAFLTRATGAPTRVALWHEKQAPRWRWMYTTDVFDPPGVHESRSIVDYYLASLSAIHVPISTKEVRLIPHEVDLIAARKLVPPNGRKILIHPGSRSEWRVWPAQNFAALSDRLQDELDVQVFVVGGPNEQVTVAAIRQHARVHVVTVNAPMELPQFAAFVAQFDLMLCHDSGPMHVAAAVGTPVVALLGSQNSLLFAPAGTSHTLLQPPLPCENCVSPGQCRPEDSYKNHCVRNITVAQAFAAVRARLGLNAATRR